MSDADTLAHAMGLARSADRRASEAISLARDARTIAVEAKGSAAEAKVEATSANEGYRSVYFALGEIATEIAQLKTAVADLGQWVRRTVHDSIRPPALGPTESGSLRALDSDRVRAISREEQRNARNARIAQLAIRVGEIIAAAVAGTLAGHFWR